MREKEKLHDLLPLSPVTESFARFVSFAVPIACVVRFFVIGQHCYEFVLVSDLSYILTSLTVSLLLPSVGGGA